MPPRSWLPTWVWKLPLSIPEDNPGGVCLYRGCIPSKALLHIAKLINETSEAKDWGVTFTKPEIKLNKLRTFKDDVVAKLTGGLGQLTQTEKNKPYQRHGRDF